jgi:hypothetical protein
MNRVLFIIGILVLLGILCTFISVLNNRFQETYLDARNRGHSPLQARFRAFGYIGMVLVAIVGFGFLLINIKTIGFGHTILIICLFYLVCVPLLAKWIFRS